MPSLIVSDKDVKGAIYEALLERHANEVKTGGKAQPRKPPLHPHPAPRNERFPRGITVLGA